MTLTVKMINEGNQPGDVVVLRGVKQGEYGIEFTGDRDDELTLPRGHGVEFTPPTGHFDDFVTIELKGKD